VFNLFAAPFALPVMLTELTIASWETVFHRTALMMSGECSMDEYNRMVGEKMRAAALSSAALAAGRDMEAVIRPYHKRAVANARRLRNA
jgi:hypothetical protein